MRKVTARPGDRALRERDDLKACPLVTHQRMRYYIHEVNTMLHHCVRQGLLWVLLVASVPAMAQGVGVSSPVLSDCLLGLTTVALVYLALWLWVGRDPRPGVIRPRNAPPEGLSPAAARFLHRSVYDHKVIAVALVDLAAKGLLGLRENDGQFALVNHEFNHPGETLRDRIAEMAGPSLFPDELAAALVLLDRRDEFAIVTRNQEVLQESITHLQDKLRSRCLGRYLHLNMPHFFTGLGVSLAVSVAVGWHAWLLGYWVEVLRVVGGGAVFFLCGYMILFNLRPMWITVINSPVDQISKGYYTIYATAATVGFAVAGTVLIWPVPAPLILFIAGITAFNLLFIHLMKAPTLTGRKVLDELEGFRFFLTGQARTTPLPDGHQAITRELFERYLPYAMALDVAEEWTARCAGSLKAEGDWYVPGWYYGSAWRQRGIPGMVAVLDDHLPNAIDVALLPCDEKLIEEARRSHNRALSRGLGNSGGGGGGE